MRLWRNILDIILLVALIGVGYCYRDDLGRLTRELMNLAQPCAEPITYSLGEIDPRFNLTKDEALAEIEQAEKIWEVPAGKQLFEYSPTGDLKINFIYDNRQKATDAIKKIGLVINNDRASYDTLKARYETLLASYDEQKGQIEARIASYEAEQKAYNQEVELSNRRGGASREEYLAFNQERLRLNALAEGLKQAQGKFNQLVGTLNSTEQVLNKLATTLNLHISNYNNVGNSAGGQFNEGEYRRDASGTVIDIYQFNNRDQLTRVLAHELGHALGLEHLDNSKAIMYYLNEGLNIKLTTDDLSALKSKCRIK